MLTFGLSRKTITAAFLAIVAAAAVIASTPAPAAAVIGSAPAPAAAVSTPAPPAGGATTECLDWCNQLPADTATPAWGPECLDWCNQLPADTATPATPDCAFACHTKTDAWRQPTGW